jgi:acyl carrier protein
LKEIPEWDGIRHALAEQGQMTESQLRQVEEIEGESLYAVELIIGLEEKYKVKIFN